MAQVVSTSYVDDLDGSAATGPVSFAIDGREYDIDLNDANAARLRDTLTPFVAAARRAGGRSSAPAQRSSGSASGRSREETQEIREILRGLGYEVKDRGRIPSDMLAAYESRTPALGQLGEVAEQPAESKSKRGRKTATDENVTSVEFSDANAS